MKEYTVKHTETNSLKMITREYTTTLQINENNIESIETFEDRKILTTTSGNKYEIV